MIRAIPPIAPLQQLGAAPQVANSDRAAGGSFAAQLNEALNEVNALQLKADDMATKLALGQIDDVHQVTIAMEKAALSLQLAVQVRNKMVEAYQEISRMQV
ncbi:MAG: flagellar hook-basal body complex protein FliE [Firmicutes bacterium]|nr:flagellar hook-basal body complex protein FliE [Dethiobacter sp.]MBS3888636.1 flagellar hook-basal body complex protein FliE [Bacillota bacterium]